MKKFVIVMVVLVLIFVMGLGFYYFWGIKPLGESEDIVLFTVEPGTSKTLIAKNLEKAQLIRSQYAFDMYLFFHHYNIQAGEYELSNSMTPDKILSKFSSGDVKINSSVITFIEGTKITDYAKLLGDALDFSKSDFLATQSDKEFLQSLIDDYWFLDESILNDDLYYPLEGYLFPDTYEFLNNLSAEDVIKMMLDHTALKLEPYKEEMLKSSYGVSELLTMASIVEKEANTDDERKMASQVFYTRLNENWSLGSDVTAFYGSKKEMGKDSETWEVLNAHNPYNTRLTDGSMNGKLPIGPICNPSISSIEAALFPTATDYHYFVANTCTGELSFMKQASEFYAKTNELQESGCI